MSDGKVVSLAEGRTTGVAAGPKVITDRRLRRRQLTVPLEDCHAAFERMSYEVRTKTRRFPLFHDLSVSFPKGRRILLLGHKGSGKTVLFELLLRERPPTRGRVHTPSRLSWPIHTVQYFDDRQAVRDNIVFVSHVLGVDTAALLGAVERFCGLERKRMREPLNALPLPLRRRIGIVVVLAADFDCLLIDHPMRATMFGLEGRAGREFEEAILSRDYIASVTLPRHRPANCDLAYLLYEGRLYMFEDVDEAIHIYNSLPVPETPGGLGASSKDEDDDEDYREEGF